MQWSGELLEEKGFFWEERLGRERLRDQWFKKKDLKRITSSNFEGLFKYLHRNH